MKPMLGRLVLRQTNPARPWRTVESDASTAVLPACMLALTALALPAAMILEFQALLHVGGLPIGCSPMRRLRLGADLQDLHRNGAVARESVVLAPRTETGSTSEPGLWCWLVTLGPVRCRAFLRGVQTDSLAVHPGFQQLPVHLQFLPRSAHFRRLPSEC